MKRRDFLRGSAALATVSLLAGCSGDNQDTKPSQRPGGQMTVDMGESWPREDTETPYVVNTPPPIQFSVDRMLDLRELGADPAGRRPITPLLEQHINDNTVFLFPDGQYLLNQFIVDGLSNFGMVAKGDATPTLIPTTSAAASGNSLITLQGENIVLSGLEFDFRGDGRGGNVSVIAEQGDYYVGDIQIKGVMPMGVSGMATGAYDPNGTGIIERFIARDGSQYGSSSHGMLVKHKHAGELYLRDCEIWNWSDNGVYASGPGYVGEYGGVSSSERGDGPVHIEGGVFKNNNISNVRIGTTGSSVRGAVIRNEKNPSGDTWDSREHDINTAATDTIDSRGIWARNRHEQVIEDCSIYMETGTSSGAIVSGSGLGDLTIRNTDITVTTDEVEYPILAKSPDWESAALTLDGVAVNGTAGKGKGLFISRRDGTHMVNCHVELSGDEMDGVVFVDSDETSVADSYFSVSGEAIVYRNSNGTVDDIERPSSEDS